MDEENDIDAQGGGFGWERMRECRRQEKECQRLKMKKRARDAGTVDDREGSLRSQTGETTLEAAREALDEVRCVCLSLNKER